MRGDNFVSFIAFAILAQEAFGFSRVGKLHIPVCSFVHMHRHPLQLAGPV
jgi:hypothetical protein